MPKSILTPEADINKTYVLTANALQGLEEHIKARVVLQINNRLNEMLAKLAACGMDSEAAFPYPKSTRISRNDYIRGVSDFHFCDKYFATTDGRTWRNDSDPRPVALRTNSQELVEHEAAKYAKEATASFIHKIAGKMAAHAIKADLGEVTGCQHTGDMWAGSTVSYQTAKGEVHWHTQTIINLSILGKLFNQFPTRLCK